MNKYLYDLLVEANILDKELSEREIRLKLLQHNVVDKIYNNYKVKLKEYRNVREITGFRDVDGNEIKDGDTLIYTCVRDATQHKEEKVYFSKEVGAWYCGGMMLCNLHFEQMNDVWKKEQNFDINKNQYLKIK